MRMACAVLGLICIVVFGGCGPTVRAKSFWATTAFRMPCCSTYAWNEANRVVADETVDPELITFLECRIEAELAALCYEKQSQDERPDFLISYHAGAAIQPTSSGPTNMAMLAVEAHNSDGRLLWRGWAEAALNTFATPEMRRERLENTIRAIVQEFHPECFRDGEPTCHCS